MEDEVTGQELSEELSSYWEVLATSRSSFVQNWSARDLGEAYTVSECIENRFRSSDDETRERMREAMLILSEAGGGLGKATKDDVRDWLESATTFLLIELLKNAFLTQELLSEVLLRAEKRRHTAREDGEICLQRLIDSIAMQICLNRVESICRGADNGHSVDHQLSLDCQRRACERVMRRRWRNALRLGEEHMEELETIIREFLPLYPRQYSSLLIGMLSASAIDCGGEVPARDISGIALEPLSTAERERLKYDVDLTNLSIVRFLEELTVDEGAFLWEVASWPVVSCACQSSDDFLKFFIATAADLLVLEDVSSLRRDRALACVRYLAMAPLSRPQQAAKELLGLVAM